MQEGGPFASLDQIGGAEVTKAGNRSCDVRDQCLELTGDKNYDVGDSASLGSCEEIRWRFWVLAGVVCRSSFKCGGRFFEWFVAGDNELAVWSFGWSGYGRGVVIFGRGYGGRC